MQAVDVSIKLVILDRDGVINEDSDSYIKTPSEWIPIPGSLEAIATLKSAGWSVAVATNQSGLARGLFDEKTLYSIHQKMNLALAEHSAKIDYLVWCPHGPSDNCNCRKPNPGLYEKIGSYFHCSLRDVPVIGDSKRDLDAALAVGALPILVETGKGRRTISEGDLPKATKTYLNLQAAVYSLLLSEDHS